MANMLIRTRHYRECKVAIAISIRVLLFFGIPSFYLLFLHSDNVGIGKAESADVISHRTLDENVLRSRRLLGLPPDENVLRSRRLLGLPPDENVLRSRRLLGLPPDENVLRSRRLLGLPPDENVLRSRRLLGLPPDAGNCTPAAISEFPPDGFNHWQRRHGFIVIHCVLAVYCFLLLGTVCEQYFVPAIEKICERIDIAADVAGATFMAAASSSPELFINCVGTFVTEGDLGIGAIVGSAVFNVLAVPACCALFANRVIELDWWSISRDCLMYALAVVALILTLLDNRIYWHEALLLVLMYTLYILAMVFNGCLGRFVRSGCYAFNKPKLYTEKTPLLMKGSGVSSRPLGRITPYNNNHDDLEQGFEMKRQDSITSEESVSSLWSWPDEKSSGFRKSLWVLTWPISLVLWVTVPDSRRHPRLYPLTFAMCIVWIGGVSYIVAWIITIIGDTLDVPDSITGLTILAAGTSLPEAVSSILVTNHGHGTMGISNSIGSNTFDILLCLGLPWLIKSLFYPSAPGNHWVSINSAGMSYSAISLLSTLLVLYGSLAVNKFQLDWKIGLTCLLVYAGFMVLATLIELNVFFQVNLPVCPH